MAPSVTLQAEACVDYKGRNLILQILREHDWK